MGKRSDMPRVERDFYPTPWEAVVPLLPHLGFWPVKFDEPCCGDGALAKHLQRNGHTCVFMSDIDPKANYGKFINATERDSCQGEMFITNPPYTWKILDPLITHLSDIAPTWLLLPADMMHNKRMAPHMARCEKVVSIGRVKWFGNQWGMENSAWYLFDTNCDRQTQFFSR
jgi:hypothetical protein